MSSEKAHSNNDNDPIAQQDGQETENTPVERTHDVAELHKMLDTLEADYAQMSEKLDKVMRAYADAENRAKRAEKDRAEAVKFGPTRMARDLLDVADNFERALKAFPETEENALKEVFEGLQLTEKSLHQVFNRFDVKKIEFDDKTKFDPNFHEAVTQIPMPDKEAGDIIDVVRSGYTIGERLLRPAQVVTVAG